MVFHSIKGIVQPKKRGVKRGFIPTVMTSYTIADIFLEHFKVHKIEIFFGFNFEICIISLLVMSKFGLGHYLGRCDFSA